MEVRNYISHLTCYLCTGSLLVHKRFTFLRVVKSILYLRITCSLLQWMMLEKTRLFLVYTNRTVQWLITHNPHCQNFILCKCVCLTLFFFKEKSTPHSSAHLFHFSERKGSSFCEKIWVSSLHKNTTSKLISTSRQTNKRSSRQPALMQSGLNSWRWQNWETHL